MNTSRQNPKPHELHESAAGEEDPGSGLDSADSAIHPDGVAPSAEGTEPRKPEPRPPAAA
ncbi:hypothetical protein [Xylophilus sp. GOD-11R]|uniref:hypothetical protein n=1 Tax=Xylophilus sp. GOD-11R TaxID=3089814 RepID=UPI00298D0717|nr:hypothetical protein [Xylophilus sp. GOD-11R]WPB55754.1 hypothetical protein R9X41_16615 [Xylophilus sp. GOD-11R]